MTIGHSTLPVETFVRVLNDNHVHLLADIRTIPKSLHNPQFGQDQLAPALEAAGIHYHWFRALGGLRRTHKDSINMGWHNASFRGFADYMQTAEFAQALDELLAFAPHETTAVMCAEAVPWRCHRSLVADALTARGVETWDVMFTPKGESHREPHKLTKFARIEGQRLWYPPEDGLFTAASGEPQSATGKLASTTCEPQQVPSRSRSVSRKVQSASGKPQPASGKSQSTARKPRATKRKPQPASHKRV